MSEIRKLGTIIVEGVATDEEISKASELTGIPEWEFKRAMGKQLTRSDAKNIDEAVKQFTHARSGSEEEFAAQLRYNELLADQIAKTKTVEEMIVFINSQFGSELVSDNVQNLTLRRIIQIQQGK